MASLNPAAASFVPSFGSSSPSVSTAATSNENVSNLSSANSMNTTTEGVANEGTLGDKSKKRKRNKNKNSNPKDERKHQLVHKLGMACKHNQPDVGLEAYREAKAEGVEMKPEIFNMLITLLSGLSNHIKVAEDDAPLTEAHSDAAFELYRDSKMLGINLQEPAYTSLMRICHARSDVVEANRLLQELKVSRDSKSIKGVTIRLRTYLPLLNLHVDLNQCEGAFSVYQDIVNDELVVGEREYVLLLKVATAAQDTARGEQIVKALAEDCLRPSKVNTWPVLIDWFKSPASYQHMVNGVSTGEESSSSENEDAWRVVRKGEPMGVDEITGTWGRTKQINTARDGAFIESVTKEQSLLSIDLTFDQKQRMMNTISKIAMENSKNSKEDATRKWNAFTRWLGKMGKNKFDVIIDGANVGYYKQNYAGAPKHVAFDQIDWVLRHFQRMGHRPLIILHQRHSFVQNLPKKYEPMVQRWRDENVLYSTPSGSNDDWYWLYAALWLNIEVEEDQRGTEDGVAASTAPSTTKKDTSDPGTAASESITSTTTASSSSSSSAAASTASAAGGLNNVFKLKSAVHVITNDEMRDHYFCMPSETVSVAEVQSFMRWKERHQVHFDFGLFDKKLNSREVFIFKPTSFSIRMQHSTVETMNMNILKLNDMTIGTNTKKYVSETDETAHVAENASSSKLKKDEDKIVAWHVPCWQNDASAKGFIGHEYSHAEEFANLSKPANPADFEWISFIRESYFNQD